MLNWCMYSQNAPRGISGDLEVRSDPTRSEARTIHGHVEKCLAIISDYSGPLDSQSSGMISHTHFLATDCSSKLFFWTNGVVISAHPLLFLQSGI